MSLTALLIFALALMVNSGSPGPSIAALVSRVLQSGWQSVIPFLAAMWIGEALWLGAAVFGLAAIAEAFHQVFVIFKYAGIAFLLYLAWKMWTAPVNVNTESLPKAGGKWGMFSAGMALTLGNPKIMVFYLALLPGLIDVNSVHLVEWLELTIVLIIVLAFTDLAWVIFASLARNLLRSPKAVGLTNKISAGMMTGAAMVIASRE